MRDRTTLSQPDGARQRPDPRRRRHLLVSGGLVATLLEEAGYEVREAASGREALALADEERPALVLLDVVLPEVSGYELCRTLRERFGETLPIIFLSGSRTDPLDSVAGLTVGADDYIIKPFVPQELIARVRRALTRSAGLSRTNGAAANGLTPREREVLSLLAEGLTQNEIADRLVMSPKHPSQLVLGGSSASSTFAAGRRLIGLAYRFGLVDDVAAHMLVFSE